jgi:hypothetical protein
MPRAGLMPTAVPCGDDQTVYLVVDSAGSPGSAYQDTKVEIDLEIVICGLIAGHFNDPVRIIAFDTLGDRSNDVSKEVAEEIQARCDIDAMPVPEHVRDFVESHTRRVLMVSTPFRSRFFAHRLPNGRRSWFGFRPRTP